MTVIVFCLALLTFVTWLVGGLEVYLGSRKLDFLRDVPLPADPFPAFVSIIVAARNEAANVAAPTASLLSQVGVDYEIIFVDDRSTDGTADVVVGVPDVDGRLRLVTIDELPSGWLGKANALRQGAAVARGEWILFTDADVILAADSVRRGLAYASARDLDHLAVTPELTMPTLATDLFGGAFVLFFTRYARPWRARTNDRDAYIGIGAFNLMRSSVYREIGGHDGIRLQTDDDLMLGREVKRAGYRQDVAYGTGLVQVEWYATLREAIQGLEKNAFVGLGYSIPRVVSAVLAILVFVIWPWFSLGILDGFARWMNLGSVVMMLLLYISSTRASGASPWLALGIPFAAGVIGFATMRSALIAVITGTITWRGTTYDLAELRGQRR